MSTPDISAAPLAEKIRRIERISLTLTPRHLEVLSKRTVRQLLQRLRRREPGFVIQDFLHESKRSIDENIFNSYLAGKKKAALERGQRSFTIYPADMPQVERLRDQYTQTLQRIVSDLSIDIQTHQLVDLNQYVRRCDATCQLAVWTAYNQGKLAQFKEFLHALAQAQIPGAFVFITANDDRVDDQCAPLHGQWDLDPDLLPQPPLHFGCRCTIEWHTNPPS